MNKIISTLVTALILLTSHNAVASNTTEQHGAGRALAQSNPKSSALTVQSYQSHVWFHRVDLYLSGDINHNGFYHRLEVELDADTSMPYLPVFAEFSLLSSNGTERVYYTSSVFELFRDSADDWLSIDTILEQHYRADEYLLTIRLFDANTGYLVAEISGFDDVNLDYLALEDLQRDRHQSTTTIEASAGSTGIVLMLGLSLLMLVRRSAKAG